MTGSLDAALPVLAGLALALGLLLIARAIDARRTTFAARVAAGRVRPARPGLRAVVSEGSWLVALLESLGSTGSSVEKRLVLLGRTPDLPLFRLQQAIAGIGGIALAALVVTPFVLAQGSRGVAVLVLLVLLGAVGGASGWDRRLTHRARSRQRRIDAQVPDASELLALAVGAGESIPAGLERIARISRSDLAEEIDRTTAEIRLGTPSTRALAELAERNDSAPLDRLCQTLITAIERGSPLARVLHDQARDIREASRQRLLEEGGKREIAMLFPVVFLILPVTVLFALYPGLMALELAP